MANIFIHPERKHPRLRPLKAMKHMKRLINDKEDTEQVFHIIEALNGKSLYKDLQKFVATERGARLLAEKQFLPPILDDHSWIRKLPAGTVGRAYVEFMEREGLSAAGLVEESEKFYSQTRELDDDLRWYGNRLRDTHDLFHVLSGYGRDALGEDALLAFSYSQNSGPGVMFISYMGARQIRKEAPAACRIMDVMKEGKRHGKLATKIVQEDILALMEEPLEAARARLNIQPPKLYRRALEIFADAGIPPLQVAA